MLTHGPLKKAITRWTPVLRFRMSVALVILIVLVALSLATRAGSFWAVPALTGALGILVGMWLSVFRPLQAPSTAKFADLPDAVEDKHSAIKMKSRAADGDFELERSLSEKDPLTGLDNRIGLEKFVRKALACGEPGAPHCLLFIDLDGFKQVNDALGHSQGDRLLSLCADRLKMVVSHDLLQDKNGLNSGHIVARFGGDEFVVFVSDEGSGNVAQKLANRILRVFSESFQLGSKSVKVGASIGVAFSPDHGDDYRELLRMADVAMYQAKNNGKNRCEFFHPRLLDVAREAEKEENEVREALTRGEFELYFQPLFDARTMEICSAEALLRWNHPRRGLLLPGEFFPAIERSNLGPAIDEWVINLAVAKAAELERAGTPLMIAVNVSPNRLESLEFPALVRSSVTRWKCSPELIQIEATEDAAVLHPQVTLRNLAKLADFGVSVAIDDFGTGYSNLANLIMLPVSRLKIDRSLLADVEKRTEAHVLVQTIVSLANSLGFHSVAEGVETEEQMRILQSMGCDVLQGFLFSKPVSFANLKALAPQFQRRTLPGALAINQPTKGNAQVAA